MDLKDILQKPCRVVVKIGSSLLVDPESLQIRGAWLGGLANDISKLRGAGHEVIVVSSGAIAIGRGQVRDEGRWQLRHAQAAAAIGQIGLAGAWASSLGEEGCHTAQILLTLQDTEERRRYLNARDTLATLLESDVVPVINENDTIATEEIRFGDNDRLAARVAAMMEADLLVLLSDIDGFYDRPPHLEGAQHIPVIEQVSEEIRAMAGASGALGSGGMATKLDAAEIACQAGCAMVIGLGVNDQPLTALTKDARHTIFLPTSDKQAARRAWIQGSLAPKGHVVVDDGAVRALADGRSLLAVGIISAEGHFLRGDSLEVRTEDGRLLAVGLAGYDVQDVQRIIGKHSHEIAVILGPGQRGAVIHRDHLVLKK
mgnify:CR=1 FL=1